MRPPLNGRSLDALMMVAETEARSEVVYFGILDNNGSPEGVADYQGVPHHFKPESPGLNSATPGRFRLTPLSPEAFQAALDGWKIRCRLGAAVGAGRVSPLAGRALPTDDARRREAERIVSEWLFVSGSLSFLASAKFRPVGPDGWHTPVVGAIEVQWGVSASDAGGV